jgi:hypothetical protein
MKLLATIMESTKHVNISLEKEDRKQWTHIVDIIHWTTTRVMSFTLHGYMKAHQHHIVDSIQLFTISTSATYFRIVYTQA